MAVTLLGTVAQLQLVRLLDQIGPRSQQPVQRVERGLDAGAGGHELHADWKLALEDSSEKLANVGVQFSGCSIA